MEFGFVSGRITGLNYCSNLKVFWMYIEALMSTDTHVWFLITMQWWIPSFTLGGGEIRIRECQGGRGTYFWIFWMKTEVVASTDRTFLLNFSNARACDFFSQAWYWSSARLWPLCMYCWWLRQHPVMKCKWLSVDMKIHFLSCRHHGVHSL